VDITVDEIEYIQEGGTDPAIALPLEYLCAKRNTHPRFVALADDHRAAFPIVLVGNPIADYERLPCPVGLIGFSAQNVRLGACPGHRRGCAGRVVRPAV
jgi:hypothetical protein